ncbi:MAG: Rpn family recombination-promoting nuclease/putative transposase [Cytophagales bacterium]|nr:Rpn family recombination-promoting nuclease/putative transposase [Bernardetiaceae bacterium]MDW8205315.1 Rpn family recombination-promoting nuclease/putative transposase [Cytophagales bacterium]
MEFTEKYINPFTEYGFKRLFGEATSKELPLDFLNELLQQEQGRITSLTYLKTDRLGSGEENRRTVFDLYCENERGKKFFVELQKNKQKFFKDRTVYYSTFPIGEQAQRSSDRNFELHAVYMVAILDFVFDEDKAAKDKFCYNVKLTDIATCNDKLTFIYLEMPKFTKSLHQLTSRFDKWMYVLRNLNKLDRVPEELREGILVKLFELAEIAQFNREKGATYEENLKLYRDLKHALDIAREEGRAEGIAKVIELVFMVISLFKSGKSVEEIATQTGMKAEQIAQILQKI